MAFIAVFIVATQSFAVDLMDVYQEALEYDPQFKAAYDSYMSTTEAIPQARSALYPQLTLNGQSGRFVNGYVSSQFSETTYYHSNIWQVAASQAIFNFQAWARVSQAKAIVKAAQATFNSAAQNLILRTAKVYLDILLAKDTLRLAEAKRRANKRQLDLATERFKSGLNTITSVYEAKTAYDLSQTTIITARILLNTQYETLTKLTNHSYEAFAPLRTDDIPLIKPEPNNVDQWIDAGLRQNYNLLAAKYSLENARENIKAISAGNWPVFSLQTNTVQTNNVVSASSVLIPTKDITSNVALNVNLPLVQGGLVQSRTRQAQSDFRLASDNLEQAHREVVGNSRIVFKTITEGINRVKADRETVSSQRSTLEYTEAQFELGTRTMIDVVNAQQRLFDIQLQLAQDQYNLIYSTLTLKYLAGTLNVNDLELVNSWLKTTRVNRPSKAN